MRALNHVVVVVAPGIAGDQRGRGRRNLGGVRAIDVVDRAEDDDRSRAGHHGAHVGAALRRSMQVGHLAGIAPRQPLLIERQLGMCIHRRNAAQVEAQLDRALLHVVGGHAFDYKFEDAGCGFGDAHPRFASGSNAEFEVPGSDANPQPEPGSRTRRASKPESVVPDPDPRSSPLGYLRTRTESRSASDAAFRAATD